MLISNLHVWQSVIGVRLQAAIKSLLYRKALRISIAKAKTSLGNIVTLITKDIGTLERDIWMIKDFVLFFIESGTIIFLIYGKMRYPGLIGVALAFSVVPVQS